MFERRLRAFLYVLFSVGLVLLARAFQLQVFAHDQWEQQAEGLGHRRHLIETTRGTIKDYRGIDIAIDEPCIDACVEYGAIAKDKDWIRTYARRRLMHVQPDVYRRADESSRQSMLAAAEQQVSADIDHMWQALASQTGQPLQKILQTKQTIQQRVDIRQRYLQFRKFEKAQAERNARLTGKVPWYQRLLAFGTDDDVDIDSFEIHTDDTQLAHPIVRDIPADAYTQLAKDIDQYPGLVLKEGSYRYYPRKEVGCQVLGSVGIVRKEDLDSPQNDSRNDLRRYLPIDLIGRSGLERLAEPTLRGTRGYIEYPAGEPDEILAEQKAVPGQDVRSTIDIDLEAEVQNFFKTTLIIDNTDQQRPPIRVPMHGAAVVIDIPTDQVRAMVSCPDFDPNELSDIYSKLATDYLNAPLMNRATQAQLEPGSTAKPMVGLGAITDGTWTATKGIECTGYLIINGKRQPNGKCWTMEFRNWKGVTPEMLSHHRIPTQFPHHGRYGNPDGFLCFSDALERSCNVYFETVANMMGPERLGYWFSRFGLGHETGVGIAEACGQIPTVEDRFPPSLTWFSGIGQARVRATPIQMANAVATIARNGIWMKPKLLVGDVKTNPVPLRHGRTLPDRVNLHLSPDALAACKEGMTLVCNHPAGTGFMCTHLDNLLIAGKTGTAQAHEQYELDDKGRPKIGPDGRYLALTPATYDHPTDTPWYRGWGQSGTHFDNAWFVGFARRTIRKSPSRYWSSTADREAPPPVTSPSGRFWPVLSMAI